MGGGVVQFESHDSETDRFTAEIVSAQAQYGPWQIPVSAMGGLLKTFEYLSSTHGLGASGANPSGECRHGCDRPRGG